MGNTIRREPVNFSIPASPDYKFLNITNFRGLDVSSNPFELATNTASDCLNVYVDETNTLTTRPRLEKKELKDNSNNDILPLNGTCLGVYPLHDGYLFHYTQQMKILHGDNLIEVTVENPPQRECKCFEQGNKTYLLGEGRYMVIDENGILTDVDGYVPNRSIVRLDGTVEKDEQLNLLSDVYTEKYFWDGVNDPKLPTTALETKNDYYLKSEFSNELFSGSIPLAVLENKTMLWYSENFMCGVTNFDPEFKGEFRTTFTGPSVEELGDFASSGKSFNLWGYKNNELKFYEFKHDRFYSSTALTISGLYNSNYWNISPDGYKMVAQSTDGIYLFIGTTLDDNNTGTITKTKISLPSVSGTSVTSKVVLSNNKIWVAFLVDNQLRIYSAPFKTLSFDLFDTYTTTNIYNTDFNVNVTENDEFLWLGDVSTFVLYRQNNPESQLVQHKTYSDKININPDGFAWTVSTHMTNEGVVKIHTIPNINNINSRYFMNVIDVSAVNATSASLSTSTADDFYCFYKNNFFYYKFDKEIDDTNIYPRNSILYFWNDNKKPNITITTKLTANDEDFAAWKTLKTKTLASGLITRFDNNYWFASGNTYFRTQNNDPTYFPLTETNELGDSNEDITGFNIANDTTLLAYKENRLYLIQPFYSETTGMNEYAITESKNTVGNTAIGAPIVTTLTEIPLQINNDGVYGLSQVANVSAVERIADLLSEPINERWLNEDDEVIKKAQTLNRLYWTYIILPYEKLTKVYLLDNRTNSWYYWELPIKLLNAFAKDNRAEFVDTEGNIYYLTTIDIRNMGFDTQLVTEYYDYGKKLIPWLWQSQVLYLGTMNHAKRLVNTTFILTDTDTQDGYGLQYSFKVFRKLASSVPEKELSGDLNLVRSTTKKTNISKFGFLQLKLSNITEDSQGTEAEKAYRNNKLRLVGLGLKYVLLEGLIR